MPSCKGEKVIISSHPVWILIALINLSEISFDLNSSNYLIRTLTKRFLELVFSYSVSPQSNEAGAGVSHSGSGERTTDTLV